MFRQSPSRNQRSKGIKLKSSLQICLLLAVCFWLIYQVKHSHDKKKEFEENNLHEKSGDVVLKFGRKDLHPEVEETSKKIEKHEEEETEEEDTGGEEENSKHEEEDTGGVEDDNKHKEEDTGGEEENDKHEEEDTGGEEETNKPQEDDDGGEEETKHEEEELEEDGKTEEKEDEGREGEVDEIDLHEIEKSDVDVDHTETFVDEEEGEERNEKESEKEEAAKEGQSEDENSSLDKNHEGGERNTHEAREEHYKADDASSAVTHEAQTISSEAEKGNLEKPNENTESEIIEQDNKVNKTEESVRGQNTTELTVGHGEIAQNGTFNATNNQENVSEILLSKYEDTSLLNSTITIESKDQLEVSNNTREVNAEIHDSSPQNGTERITDSTRAHFDSNSTSVQTENTVHITGNPLNSSIISESIILEQDTRSNASAELKDSIGSSEREESKDRTENEKLETSNEANGTNDGSDTFQIENTDDAQHDHIDSSDHLEEKDVRTDLDTLPEIQTEGTANEDIAAE